MPTPQLVLIIYIKMVSNNRTIALRGYCDYGLLYCIQTYSILYPYERIDVYSVSSAVSLARRHISFLSTETYCEITQHDDKNDFGFQTRVRDITFYFVIYSPSLCGGKRCFNAIVPCRIVRFRNLLCFDCYVLPGFVRTTLPADRIGESGRRTTSAPGTPLKIAICFRLLPASDFMHKLPCASSVIASVSDTRVC